jgi:hypothetical protein
MARILPRTPDMRISTKEPEKATLDAVAEAMAAQRIKTPAGYGIVYTVSVGNVYKREITYLSFDTTKYPTALTGGNLVPNYFTVDLME